MKIIKCLCGVIYGIFFVSYNIIVDASLTKNSENIAKPTTATLNSFQCSGGGFVGHSIKGG